MAKINITATTHGSKLERYAGGPTIQYNAYPTSTKRILDTQKAKTRLSIKSLALNGLHCVALPPL
jgi:hypothetical protein